MADILFPFKLVKQAYSMTSFTEWYESLEDIMEREKF